MTYLIAVLTLAAHLIEPAQQLPSAIAIAPIYRPAVAAMLRYSPTFRRQCNRIARTPKLFVAIGASRASGEIAGGALTRIVRSARGIDAVIEVVPSGDPVLLIAHEFEHILEQLDGVDLPAMATRVATGVHVVADSGHFETDRAIAAGRQVMDEVRRGRARGGT
jgi:hypothetical protein